MSKRIDFVIFLFFKNEKIFFSNQVSIYIICTLYKLWFTWSNARLSQINHFHTSGEGDSRQVWVGTIGLGEYRCVRLEFLTRQSHNLQTIPLPFQLKKQESALEHLNMLSFFLNFQV